MLKETLRNQDFSTYVELPFSPRSWLISRAPTITAKKKTHQRFSVSEHVSIIHYTIVIFNVGSPCTESFPRVQRILPAISQRFRKTFFDFCILQNYIILKEQKSISVRRKTKNACLDLKSTLSVCKLSYGAL